MTARYVFTITEEHLHGRNIQHWKLRDCIGRILPIDLGKRVYEVTTPDGYSIYQVENDEQRDKRLAK
jgi:hypothetical protein